MSVAEWTDVYGIHHWRILWSSYRKLDWVGFKPTTTEFRSDALTDWAIRSRVQLALRANLAQLLQFHRLFSVRFHFGCCLCQSPRLFQWKFSWGNHMSVAEWNDIYGIYGFFEVAIESWPDEDLNPRPLNSVQMLWSIEVSGHEFNTTYIYIYKIIIYILYIIYI